MTLGCNSFVTAGGFHRIDIPADPGAVTYPSLFTRVDPTHREPTEQRRRFFKASGCTLGFEKTIFNLGAMP